MTLERLRQLCLAYPGATEQIQWGADLVFKVGGKMFCVACTEVAPVVTSFKCSDETFVELCERDGLMPAPYMARAKWVAVERWDALDDREFKPLLDEAYRLVREKLPRKTQAALDGHGSSSATAPSRRRAAAAKKAGSTKARRPTKRVRPAKTKARSAKR